MAVTDALRWLVVVAALLLLPRLGPMYNPGRISVLPEGGVLLVALWALVRVGAPPTGWRPSWRAALLAVPWVVLMVFELVRAGVREATNEDLPFYDAALLTWHLYVLVHDLYGAWATAATVTALVAPVPLWGLGVLLFAEAERLIRRMSAGAGAALVGVPAALAVASTLLPRSSWSTAGLANNASRSWTLYRAVTRELERHTHDDLEPIRLTAKPDVLFYIVESYGRIVETDPGMASRWTGAVEDLDHRMSTAGWSTASAWVRAPVHGGRSWIADASLLLGVEINHQSEYEHVMTQVSRLPSLVSFLRERGYHTLIVKPADRERPGVPIENPFGFDQGVFAAELDYQGPVVGWGQVPDQYTIDRVQEQVLAPLTQPWFAYFHLATSHMPWTPAPPVVERWTDFAALPGSRDPIFATRSLKSVLRMELTRFRRRAPTEVQRSGETDDYLADVLYDLEVIGKRLQSGPPRPMIVVIMGDHQPPLIAMDADDDVPVHLLASDPRLLEVPLEKGFTPGLLPPLVASSLAHRDLFPLVARALERAP